MFTLWLLTHALADDTFHPDESALLVSMGDLLRGGTVAGRTGRLLVSATDAGALASLPEVTTVVPLRGGVLRVTPAAGVDDLALARALHARGDVAWVNPDLILRLHADRVPNDPLYVDQWHLENTGQGGRTAGVDINAEGAWDFATGAGITIAVLDSGVQLDHPDLRVTAGHDYIDKDEDPSPGTDWSAGHGTSCSGVAAAIGDNSYAGAGVAWNADVYAIRLIGGATTLEDVYTAFVEAVDAGAAVLSNSWGYSEDCTPVPQYRLITSMYDYAEKNGRGGLGSVVTFAAGNGNCDITGDGLLSNENIVVVAAVESNDIRAGYSDFGDPVDIAAPTTLLTTDVIGGGFGSYGGDDGMVDGFNGTSAATPVVSGVIALMMEANPRITAAQVREVLCETAIRGDVAHAGYNTDGWSPYYGCGRVDAAAAVAAVANTAPLAPAVLFPEETVWDGRAMLAWEPAVDADNDVLDYEVAWWRGAEAEAEHPRVTDTHLDLGDQLAVGDAILWKVRARDPWGDGPWSETRSLTVQALPRAPKQKKITEEGCTTAGGAGWVVVTAAGFLLRRRTPATSKRPPHPLDK